jgi:hypothetical protein
VAVRWFSSSDSASMTVAQSSNDRTKYTIECPCLVLVIEGQLRWTNMCLSEIHR